MKILKSILPYILIIVVVVLFRTFIATPVKVNGDSMYPNLVDNEILILNKISSFTKKYDRFDIVVVRYGDEVIIKRIIGLPGETISYIDNVLYVDGEIIDEKFEHGNTFDFSLTEIDSEKVPDDSYFVLGDNREVSVDSRIIGFIDEKYILGTVNIRIFPFNVFGFIE